MSEILHRTLAENRAKLVAFTDDRQLEQVVMLEREWEHMDARYAKSLMDGRNTDNLIQNPKADNVSYNGSWYPAGPLAAIGTDSRSVTIREKLVRSTTSSENGVGRQWTYTHAVNWGETRNIIVEEDMTAVARDNFLTTYSTPSNGKFYTINVSRNNDLLWDITVVERTGVAGEAQWDFPHRNGTGHKWWGANVSFTTFTDLITTLVDNATPPNSYSIDNYDIQHSFTPKNEYELGNYTIVATPRNVSWSFNDTSTHYDSYIEKRVDKPDGIVSGGQGGDITKPVDGVYWRLVSIKYSQKFSLTATGAKNHITGGLIGSKIHQRSSPNAYFVSMKIERIVYGAGAASNPAWSANALPTTSTINITALDV